MIFRQTRKPRILRIYAKSADKAWRKIDLSRNLTSTDLRADFSQGKETKATVYIGAVHKDFADAALWKIRPESGSGRVLISRKDAKWILSGL
jgi:hypothetical protein